MKLREGETFEAFQQRYADEQFAAFAPYATKQYMDATYGKAGQSRPTPTSDDQATNEEPHKGDERVRMQDETYRNPAKQYMNARYGQRKSS